MTWCRRSLGCTRTTKRLGSGSGCCALAAMHDRSIVQTLMETGDAAAEKAGRRQPRRPSGSGSPWNCSAATCFSPRRDTTCSRPRSAHSARARELLRAGKTAEAIEELHQAEAVQPANIQLALDCDVELRKHGAAGEADALYRRMLEQHEVFCRDFPHSGTYHNDLAWLAANLDRDLDKALAHAQRAVELEPQSAGILDTLAEVHFRRGNRAEAVRLAKRCLEMEPDGAALSEAACPIPSQVRLAFTLDASQTREPRPGTPATSFIPVQGLESQCKSPASAVDLRPPIC